MLNGIWLITVVFDVKLGGLVHAQRFGFKTNFETTFKLALPINTTPGLKIPFENENMTGPPVKALNVHAGNTK